MTNHEQEPEPTPFDVDAHDPVVAEQFELLNGVTPPDPVVVERPMVAGATALAGRRSFVLATAAAAAVLVIGLAAFAVSRGGDTVDVAGELPTADETDGASEPGDTDGDVGELVVSTTTSDAAEEALDLAPDDDAEDAGDASDDDQSEPGSDDGDASDDSDNSNDDNSEPGDSDAPSTDDEATPLPDNGTGKDSSVDDRVGQVVTIRGVITEVMLDCNSHVKLNEKGEIVNDGAVMCDGGNFIVVDGRTVFTTSGYVAESMAFNKHPEWIKPGQRVVVTAMQEPGGWTHLDCDRCQIRMG